MLVTPRYEAGMGKIISTYDKWTGRAANTAFLWPLVPSGLIGVLTGYLSTSVQWISQFGLFGWFATGLLGFLASSAAFAMLSRSRLWRVEARMRERTIGDSSPFDPMAKIYEGKRLYLRDLAPMGRRIVMGKKFVNCELIGPGTAVIGLDTNPAAPSTMRNTRTFDVDCIQIAPNPRSLLAVEFVDCDFEDCSFYHMTLLFFRRENEALHWITPDFEQLRLPADKT